MSIQVSKTMAYITIDSSQDICCKCILIKQVISNRNSTQPFASGNHVAYFQGAGILTSWFDAMYIILHS